MKHDIYKTWIEIRKEAIKHNIEAFRKIVGPKTKIMAVVKSNAYGHGLLEFSKLADSLGVNPSSGGVNPAKGGVNWFGVDTFSEGLKLRQHGIKKPILVLGYTRNSRLLEAAKNNISLTFYNLENLDFLKKHTKEFLEHPLKVHLKIDTGMRRQGIYLEDLSAFLRQLKTAKTAISVEGVYTHFASAKDITYPFYTKNQLDKFHKAVRILEKFNIKNVIKHAAATGGMLLYPESRLDMVRIGIGLYGLWPSKEAELQHKLINRKTISLKPVLTWKTIIAQVKKVKKGDFIGYDLAERMECDGKIAMLPIGYWHGYDRGLSSIGEVLINGIRCRVLGKVSMDMIVVDVTKAGKVKVEKEVVLLGRQKNEEITARELAQKIGTVHYEIITRINPQTPRIVI